MSDDIVTIPAHRTLEDRRALCATDGVTLDGDPAVVIGCNRKFATVANLSTGAQFEYTWRTVACTIAEHGAFTS